MDLDGHGARNTSTSTIPGRRVTYWWLSQFFDVKAFLTAIHALPSYIRSFRAFRKLSGEELRWRETIPRLLDSTPSSPFDPHYFYLSAWAMKHIDMSPDTLHVDIGGPVNLAACMASRRPTAFLDYRPLDADLAELYSIGGDLLQLPFRDRSLESLSCLHVVEHVGLGRYGDALDPEGTRKACRELERTLAPGGVLLIALPVGRPGVHFNAHRIHSPAQVIHMMPDLRLVEFSLVDDRGRFSEKAPLVHGDRQKYGCGLFRFTRD